MKHTHTPRESAGDQHSLDQSDPANSNAALEAAGPMDGEILEAEPIGQDDFLPISIESFIRPAMFFPDPQWVEREVIAHGAGSARYLARIFGVVHETTVKPKETEGRAWDSYRLDGLFEAEDLIRQQVVRARTLYIPALYAKQVHNGLAGAGAGATAPVDFVVGVRATGKTIRYAWTITTLIDDGSYRELDRMRAKRHPMLKLFQEQATAGLLTHASNGHAAH